MKTRSYLLGFVALMAIAGCGKGGGSGGAGGAPKDPSDFSYNPPADFKQQDKQGKNGATFFLGPKVEGFTSNIQVMSGRNDKDSAKQIGEQTLAKLVSSSGATVKEQEPYKIPDSDAYTWLVLKAMPNHMDAEQRQFVVMKNGIVVEFTLSATAMSFSQFDQELADSLQSFKWGR